MSKFHREVLLRIVKGLNVLLLAVPFTAVWYCFYMQQRYYPFQQTIQYVMTALFIILYFLFGRVYEAFQLSFKRIQELVYSQCLAVLATDGVLFLITWLLTMRFPPIGPLVLCMVVQGILAAVWTFVCHHWYFRQFPPQETAIIYDTRLDIENLVNEYGLSKKYNIQQMLSVEECLSDLTLLDRVETVFVSGVHSKERNVILKYCIEHDIEVLMIPRIGDVLMSGAKSMHMFHLPMLKVKRYDATPEYLFVKRFLDIVLSLTALVVLSPIMLAVAIAIKAYDGGPILYSQVRLTKDRREFRIFKFRSMRPDAEKDGVARLSTGDRDDRITPVGKVIRKLRVDELPQLFNILSGSLSICGPRPERPEIAEQYEQEMPEFALRLQAKAGLTGYAQVYGKYNTTPYHKLQMDLMYIAHPSIVEDLKIMMATVKILFMPESTDGVEEGQTTAVNS